MRHNSVEQTTFSGLVVMVNDLLSAKAELFSATPLTPGQIQSALHQIYDLVQGHRTAVNAKEGEGQMLAIPSGLYTGRSTSKLLKLGENAKDEYKFLVNNLPKLVPSQQLALYFYGYGGPGSEMDVEDLAQKADELYAAHPETAPLLMRLVEPNMQQAEVIDEKFVQEESFEKRKEYSQKLTGPMVSFPNCTRRRYSEITLLSFCSVVLGLNTSWRKEV